MTTKTTLSQADTKHFKSLLEKEYVVVETELKTLGRQDPKHPQEWNASSDSKDVDTDIDTADENLVADNMDNYESNKAILDELEPRLFQIKSALQRIENGSYAVCDVCKNTIEKDRLEANPAATTCKAHL